MLDEDAKDWVKNAIDSFARIAFVIAVFMLLVGGMISYGVLRLFGVPQPWALRIVLGGALLVIVLNVLEFMRVKKEFDSVRVKRKSTA